jgi:hypothetical protein
MARVSGRNYGDKILPGLQVRGVVKVSKLMENDPFRETYWVRPTTSGSSSSMPTYGSGLLGSTIIGETVAIVVLGFVATAVALRCRRASA